MKILVTGGTGFIGSHIVKFFAKKGHWVTILDRSSFAGTRCRFNPEEQNKIKFISHDLRYPINNSKLIKELGTPDYVLHLAASSHVDRSIIDPLSFVQDNVVGTCNILNWLRYSSPDSKFLYFSTDEVFGPAALTKMMFSNNHYSYKEWDRYNSSNPYAASKAGAEELCLAFANTYKLNIFITHTMNVFGEMQHHEKYIPLCISKILKGETIQIHASAEEKPGSRYYIHALNVAKAVEFLYANATVGEKYNIVGDEEIDNLALAKTIAGFIGKELKYELIDFHSSRPGHDIRYALDGSKLKEMGFLYETDVAEDLRDTGAWYLENREWL